MRPLGHRWNGPGARIVLALVVVTSARFTTQSASDSDFGCAPAPKAPPLATVPERVSEFVVARPGAPWPPPLARCVIPNDAQQAPCAAPIDILPAKTSTSPIARVTQRSYAQVQWSDLPVLGEAPVARISVRGEGLLLNGWASLKGQEFNVRQSIPLVAGHLWVPAGGRVTLLGTSGPSVAIASATPFAAPTSVEALIPCERLGAVHETTRVAAGPPYAIPLGRNIALRSGPKGAVIFSFDPGPNALFVWRGSEGGYAHIAGGQPPWQSALSDTSLLFDGWVADADVRRAETESEDRDSGCCLLDQNDQCPLDGPLSDAPFYVGAASSGPLPGAAPIGTVAKGTALRLGEVRGDLVAFNTMNDVVSPPPNQRFWVRRDAVGRDPKAPLDGCPR
jgi:hypothetical protein